MVQRGDRMYPAANTQPADKITAGPKVIRPGRLALEEEEQALLWIMPCAAWASSCGREMTEEAVRLVPSLGDGAVKEIRTVVAKLKAMWG